MKVWRFTLGKDADDELLWRMLEDAGSMGIWSEEDSGDRLLFCLEPLHPFKTDPAELVPHIISAAQEERPDAVDWHQQWLLHSPGQSGGEVEVRLDQWVPDAAIRLRPGPGFGDLSHVTTRLMIELMAPHCKGQHILDIGSGSGILTLAAAALGASSSEGIDIDSDAVAHAAKNAVLNDLDASFGLPDDLPLGTHLPEVLLLNMITSEQELAWKALPPDYQAAATLITSGILEEERDEIVARWQQRGFHLIAERDEDGWLAFALSRN